MCRPWRASATAPDQKRRGHGPRITLTLPSPFKGEGAGIAATSPIYDFSRSHKIAVTPRG